MEAVLSPFRSVGVWWAGAARRARLVVGALVVIIIGGMGLTPNGVFGVTLIWPQIALIAAVGWGRAGLAFSPMILLIAFGFVMDIKEFSPLGCFSLVYLITYGASAGVSQTFDIERSPGMNYGLPLLMLLFGMIVLWILASLSGGHFERVVPFVSTLLATVFVHMLISPVFDLGDRQVWLGGGTR